MAAAAVALLALGGALGWAANAWFRTSPGEQLIASAVDAHALYVRENRQPAARAELRLNLDGLARERR